MPRSLGPDDRSRWRSARLVVSVLEPCHLRWFLGMAYGPSRLRDGPALQKQVRSGVYRLLAEVGHPLLRRGGDALASLNTPAASFPTTSFGKPAQLASWSPESIASGGSCQETTGSASEIAEVDPTSVRRGSQARCQVQGLIDQGCIRSGLLTHITQNRPLGARRDDRVGDAIDPYFGPATIASFFAQQGHQRVYPIRTRKLAETRGNHAGFCRHKSIIPASATGCHCMSVLIELHERPQIRSTAPPQSSTASWSLSSPSASSSPSPSSEPT